MKCRDKHRQDKVPGATYQSCLRSWERLSEGTGYQLLQERGMREASGAGGHRVGQGTQGDRDFKDLA